MKRSVESAMESGKTAMKTHVAVQQYAHISFTEGPEVAVQFCEQQGPLTLTTEQRKLLREIKKDTPRKRRYDEDRGRSRDNYRGRDRGSDRDGSKGGSGGESSRPRFPPSINGM